MKVLHWSVFVICIGWALFVCLDNRLGINIKLFQVSLILLEGIDEFGFCGQTYLRENTMIWFYPVFKIIFNTAFLGLAFYTYFYFKKHKPGADGLLKRIYH